jgi:hypothetical protein
MGRAVVEKRGTLRLVVVLVEEVVWLVAVAVGPGGSGTGRDGGLQGSAVAVDVRREEGLGK